MIMEKKYLIGILFLVILVSVFVLYKAWEEFEEQEDLRNAEEEKAFLLASKTNEVKILEKLMEIYSFEGNCKEQELINNLNFLNTFSIVTGISVQIPKNASEAGEVISKAEKCVPELEKKTEKKSESIYLVSYTAVFSENCSLPEKEMKLIIETDLEKEKAEVIEGKLDPKDGQALGNNLYLLDSFGECKKEVVFKIAVDTDLIE